MGDREKLSEHKAGQKFLQGLLQVYGTTIMSLTSKGQNHEQEGISGDRSVTGGSQFGIENSIVKVACSC
ncbi:hypothetical protein CsSME_00021370 [Camellia sinensis var. sinensis]